MTEQNQNLAALSAAGVSVWLDDLSRERLASGNLVELIETRSVVGVTTNPTIFAGALAHGEAYDEQVRELVGQGADVDAAVRALTTDDVRHACDVFEGVFTATGGQDGRVSIEVDPRLAHETEQTATQAVELWTTVDRPNALIKIPATQEGLAAITRTLAQGISVNVTLIFSVERYHAVMDAYLDGLEQARANGHDPAGIHSVASFFVSRVDVEVDKRLTAIGTPEAMDLTSKAGLANARLAYGAYQQVFEIGARWRDMVAAGANPQRPLWASTGVKDPELSDTLYVTGLVGPNTVNTMPEKTLQAFADHGELEGDQGGDTVSGTAAAAQAHFDALEALGIDMADVFLTLENEGVEKFEKSWNELLETVQGQLDSVAGTAAGAAAKG